RRDAGFTIFYMGINLGAFISPLVTGALGQQFNWRIGFAAAGLGMVIGLMQYRLTSRHLGNVGLRVAGTSETTRTDRLFLGVLAGGLLAMLALGFGGVLRINAVLLARSTAWLILAVAV